MDKGKPTLTVAIPAYNEEANIANILHGLLRQKIQKLRLKEIIVYSDASTDNTEKIVSGLSRKYPIIRLIKGKDRKGKYYRVNQIFRKLKTDILVILDADINLVSDNFLQTISSVLVKDRKAQMVAGHSIPLPPQNFIGKIIYAYFMIWDYVRLSMPKYDSGLNFLGSVTAYRGLFAQSIRIPDTLDPHLFIYLTAKRLNGFRYCRDAQVLHWPISTIEDLKKLMRRSIGKRDKKLESMFGIDAENVYIVHWKYKVIGLFKGLAATPIYTLLALLLQIYITKIYHPKNVDKNAVWEIVSSTKKPIITADR